MAAALHSWKILAVCWKYIIYIWKFSCRTFLWYCCRKKRNVAIVKERFWVDFYLNVRTFGQISSELQIVSFLWKGHFWDHFTSKKGNKIWLGEDFTELKLGPEVEISCSLKWILTFLLCWIYLQPATDIACYLIVAQMSVNSKEL